MGKKHILLIGLSTACAQATLFSLRQQLPEAVFTGWSRHPETLPQTVQRLCTHLEKRDISKIRGKAAFAPFDLIISTLPPRFLPVLLCFSHCPIAALGSTRKYTKWPDQKAHLVQQAEKLFLKDGRPSFFLHPTLIYGQADNQNLAHLAKIIRHFKILPLPFGGKNLVQPIHYQDVSHCLSRAAQMLLSGEQKHPCSVILAGPKALSYKELVEILTQAQNLPKRWIIPLPHSFSLFLSFLLRLSAVLFPKLSGFLPSYEALRRLGEDKHFSILPMKAVFKLSPRPLSPKNWRKKTLP